MYIGMSRSEGRISIKNYFHKRVSAVYMKKIAFFYEIGSRKKKTHSGVPISWILSNFLFLFPAVRQYAELYSFATGT
jgi:hypothetical protein